MTTVQYTCARSSNRINGSLEGDAAWFEFHHVAQLFGVRLEQATKVLRIASARGEVAQAIDVRNSGSKDYHLSHRAVIAVGYHLDYGRATAFRYWCAAELTELLN
ncbi:hypothetical protein A9R05_21520 [Burkholderia sp. KK1]|nr:hypothetical protein A9R05_21520 [Burkholderia sp. KK1]